MKKILLLLAATGYLTASSTPITVYKTNTIDGVDVEFRWFYDADISSKTATLLTVTPAPFGELEIPEVLFGKIGGNTYSFAITEIGERAFENARALKKVSIGNDPSDPGRGTVLQKIGDYAFSNCTALASIELGYALRYIGKRPFVNTAIRELTLPDTLLDMDGNIAAGTIYDMKINISDSSHFTYSDDGVLYNKDMTKLYACPTRAEGMISIPNTVTNICTDAFFGCFRLSYLNFPTNVTTIGDGAFNVSGIWPGLDAPGSTPRLQSMFYNGPVPNAADNIYVGAPDSLTNYVFTQDWAPYTNTTWKNRPVHMISGNIDPIVLSYTDEDGITWYYHIVDNEAELYNYGNAAISPTSTEGNHVTLSGTFLRPPSSINGYVVTKIGNNAFTGCNNLFGIEIQPSIHAIGDDAFKGCTALNRIMAVDTDGASETIEIPSGITYLGKHPFEGVKALTVSLPYTLTNTYDNPLAGMKFVSSVEADANNPRFSASGNILYDKNRTTVIGVPANYNGTSISFPSSVTTIGDEALYGCENLTTLYFPDSLKEIGTNALANCTKITKVYYAGNNAPDAPDDLYEDTCAELVSYVSASSTGFSSTKWKGRDLLKQGEPGTYIFDDGTITWRFSDGDGDGVAEITSITNSDPDIAILSINLPSSLGGLVVKGIGKGALANLRGITSITIPDTYEWIGDYAFSNCTSLASIELPYGLRSIGKRPFVNTAIPELTLPDTLLDMDGNIAAGSIYDMTINISDSSHFTYSDDGVLYNKDMTKLYSCPTRAEGTITIPSTVTNICADAFFGCFRLSYLNIPETVNTIGEGAFNVSGIWPGLSAPESTPKLQSVFYNGSVPNAPDDIYNGAPAELVSYALDESWSELSEWKNRPITIIDEAHPPVLSLRDDNGITWYYRIVNGTAEIYNEDTNGNAIPAISPTSTSGTRYYEDEKAVTYATALRIPYSLNGYAVTRIGNHAFDGCKALTYVGIPSSVQEIGDYAFKGCTAIKSMNEYYNVPWKTYDGHIILPAGITSLGYHPFEGMRSSTISIPYTVNSMNGNPLAGMEFISIVEVDASNPKFYSADNIIYNKSHSTVIGVPANYDGSSISFLASVSAIGSEALYGCENLSTIPLPVSLETISTNAFAECTGLSSLTIPETVTKIESAAFSNCTALAKVTYAGNAPTAANNIYVGTPDTMASWIYEGATGFSEGTWKDRPIVVIKTEDPKDEELSYNNGVATWYFRIVDGMAEIHRDGDRTAVVSDEPIMNLTLPDTLGGYIVKGIGNGALSNLRGITSISVPNTYEWIGDYAFSNCTSLAAISLGNGVEKIGRWPFYGTKLTTLAIPDSVSEIDGNPVAGCSMMTAVSVAETPPYFSVDEDGLLFDKKQETLIACPATKSSITLPDTLKTINDDAFYGCNLMGSASTTIDDATWTFEIHDGKATITDVSGVGDTITIPATLSGYPVTGIADGAFVNCSNITAFASESSSFSAKRGILYSADGSELICVPDTITLPYSIITSNTTIKVTTHTEAGVNGGLPYVNRSTTTNFPSTKVSSVAMDGDISFSELLKDVKKIRGYAFNGVNVFETTCTTNTSADGTAFPVDETANSDVTSTITIICTTYRSEITINTATTELNRNAFKNSGLTCKLVSSMPKVNSNLRKSADTGSATDSTITYFGYLIDSDGNPAGTIQVKTAKARNGVAKTTTVIQIAGQKKQTIRSSLNASTGKVNGINLTANGTYLSGSYNGYTIEGARNLFTSKNRNETAAANAILESVPSKINIFWAGGTLSAKMARKGKVKISGTLSTGKKASASSQIIIGDEWLCIPVSLPKYSISFLLWISTKDRSITTQGLDGDAIAGEPKALKSGAFFRIDAEEVAATLSKSLSTGVKTEDILMDGIPNGVPVSQNGNAFSVSASASALKLRHTATTGSFKGSFKAYYMQNGKQKSKSVTITGVMIGDCGHGFAMTKKGEPTAISIE